MSAVNNRPLKRQTDTRAARSGRNIADMLFALLWPIYLYFYIRHGI